VTAVTELPVAKCQLCGMEIFGYAAAALIGISLGLIGGGGSILTVPVLVYLFNIDAEQATSYSLFVVGSTSLVGAYGYYRQGQVRLQTVLWLGLTSITTVFLTRRFLLPLIPDPVLSFQRFALGKSAVTMILFAVLMLLASRSMIRSSSGVVVHATGSVSTGRLILYGTGIGLVTGLLGAGGGFLLIPVLVLFMGLSMKEAVGTSLLIIALNSLVGFTGDLGRGGINWPFLVTLAAIAIVGIAIGGKLNSRIPGAQLKKGFGWLVLLMGLSILTREIIAL